MVDLGARRPGRRQRASPVRRQRRPFGAGGAGAGHARLRPPLRLQQGGAGALGRHRFGAGGGHRRPGAGPRQRAGRGHALALLIRRARAATPRHWPRNLGIQLPGDPHRVGVLRVPARRWPRPSPAARPTSPRRTCRRACAAALLMALSNKFGSLLLTTGNKSELAIGYCTLYGDMCGGLAVISDVPKTWSTQLARAVNEGGEVIPESTLTKPPSAELRPNQTDQDTLPPVRSAGRHPGSAPGGRSGPRGAGRAGLRRRAGRRRGSHGAPVGVQAPAGGARAEGHRQGVRPGPPLPDRPRLPRLKSRREAETCTHCVTTVRSTAGSADDRSGGNSCRVRGQPLPCFSLCCLQARRAARNRTRRTRR